MVSFISILLTSQLITEGLTAVVVLFAPNLFFIGINAEGKLAAEMWAMALFSICTATLCAIFQADDDRGKKIVTISSMSYHVSVVGKKLLPKSNLTNEH